MLSQVAALHVYPLKSARGITLDAADVERRGLRHDRRFLAVDDAGRFLSQRELPELALLDTALDETTLRLTAPGVGEIAVPLAPQGPRVDVRVWRDDVTATHVGDVFDEWLSTYLRVSARLVHMPDDSLRPVDPDHSQPGDHVSFADGFPLLIVGEESLADLNARLPEAIPMDRFRPNIVLHGAPAFAEDRWRRVHIGELSLRLEKPCARCVMTTIDQRTLAQTAEPLRTLAGYRRDGSKVLFGMNAIADAPGRLRVGDSVDVLDWP